MGADNTFGETNFNPAIKASTVGSRTYDGTWLTFGGGVWPMPIANINDFNKYWNKEPRETYSKQLSHVTRNLVSGQNDIKDLAVQQCVNKGLSSMSVSL